VGKIQWKALYHNSILMLIPISILAIYHLIN
jgi:hypothetical protein